jgi:ATP-dependent DNA ligase
MVGFGAAILRLLRLRNSGHMQSAFLPSPGKQKGLPRNPNQDKRSFRGLAQMLTLINPIERAEPFDHADWMFEAKFDGFRAAADAVLRFPSLDPKRSCPSFFDAPCGANERCDSLACS